MQAENLKLTVEEFYNIPDDTRAELIHGILYDMAPSLSTVHQELSMNISMEIFSYIKRNNGQCKVFSAPYDVQLSDDTIVIPDISVICDKSKITSKRCVGAPDLIIEIVSNNALHDYITKLNLYQSFGVKEYWIVDPKKKYVTVFNFGEDFDTNKYDFCDTIPVGIFGGNLKINIDELMK